MSKTFQLSKYIDDPSVTEPLEEGGEVGKRKVTRTISITEVGKQGLSGSIAKALIEALRLDDIELIRTETKPRNEIFKNIKFVSTESINGGSVNVIEDVQEGDIVFTDLALPDTDSEIFFEYNIKDKGIKPYRVVERLKDRIVSDFEESIKDEMEEIKDKLERKNCIVETNAVKAPEELMEVVSTLKFGNCVSIGGVDHKVIFIDDNVCLLCTKDEGKTYKLFDVTGEE